MDILKLTNRIAGHFESGFHSKNTGRLLSEYERWSAVARDNKTNIDQKLIDATWQIYAMALSLEAEFGAANGT